MTTKIYKHDVWEWSRDMSMYLAGVPSRELLAVDANAKMIDLVEASTEEQKDEIVAWATELRERIHDIQIQAETTAKMIIETLGIPTEVGLWRTADLTKYLGATQKYDNNELLVSGVLAVPNLELLFEMVEPDYDE